MVSQDKVPCASCGTLVLPSTVERTGGLCMPCYRGPNEKSFSQRVNELAVRMGLMSDDDAEALNTGTPFLESNDGQPTDESIMSEEQWLEEVGDRTIDQVIELEGTHRIDSIVLAIEAALMDRENLTPTERIVLTVEAMEREVGNGGFNQFFFNSSNEYAHELVATLREIGIPDIADIAERALRAIGAKPDWTCDDFEEASVDPDEPIMEELNACDSAYYNTEDGIANTLFEYIKRNKNDIDLGAGPD